MFFGHSSPSLREIKIYSNYKDITLTEKESFRKKVQCTEVLKSKLRNKVDKHH